MSFKKSNLLFKDYKETAVADHDNPDIRNFPDDRLLNRTEAYEMVRYINGYAKKEGWLESSIVAKGQQLESLIRTKVPGNLHSHKHITEWLKKNATI